MGEEMRSMSGSGRLGFDQLLWVNKKNMKRKFLGFLACAQNGASQEGKRRALESVPRGASAAFPWIYPVWPTCLKKREALALTPDPEKAASIAPRHSHAMQGGRGVCQEAG